VTNKFSFLTPRFQIKKITKYLTIFLNGVLGIFIEIIYTLGIFLLASIICFLFYILIIF